MSAWTNLINPFEQTIGFAKAPFESHNDDPWLQGTVRNFAAAGAGDDLTNKFNQTYLGDTANGYYRPQDDPANAPSPTIASLQGQPSVGQTTAAPTTQPATGVAASPTQTAAMTNLAQQGIMAWLKAKQGNQQGGISQ